jgi:hypothetical protein
MRETPPTLEFSTEEQELIENLRAGTPEAREKLIAWTEAQEAIANGINTSRANIEMNLRRAKLYKAAGLQEEAWDVLENIRLQAYNENEIDLYQSAMSLMDEIESEKE